MDSKPLGGSTPLVELVTKELDSQGIKAVNVEFLIPCSLTSALKASQSNCNLRVTILSTSLQYVSIGSIPLAYFVRSKYSHAPFSLAKLTEALIREYWMCSISSSTTLHASGSSYVTPCLAK